MIWGAAWWGRPDDWFPVFACDPAPFRAMWDELRVDPESQRAYERQKDGALVGTALACRFGWTVGQRLSLTGAFHPVNPEVQIVGIYTAPDSRDEQRLWYRWDYHNELAGRPEAASAVWIRARTAADLPVLKELIDGRTRNSPDPTETMTESEYGAQFVQMWGNLTALVVNASVLVLGILVLITANTVAMSARERVREIAVMRTLGFTAPQILELIVAEAVVLTLGGALLAVGAALLLFNAAGWSPVPAFFPVFRVEAPAIAAALAGGVLGGVLSAAVPAWRASRRTIVDALRSAG
jgi:putative ABC transport system permease protein